MEVAGHMAVTGHTRHLGYEREQWGTNSSPGYGVCIQIQIINEIIE